MLRFLMVIVCLVFGASDVRAAPPFQRQRKPWPAIYRPGVTVLPTTAPPKPKPGRVKAVRPKAPVAKPKAPRVVKREKVVTTPPTPSNSRPEELATLGVALRIPMAAKVLRFIHLMGSVRALVPVLGDEDVFDATLTARRAPAAAVQADIGLEMRADDFVLAVGLGHGLRNGVGFSFFAILSYRPDSRQWDRERREAELLLLEKAPDKAPKPAEGR